jgi:four helix bundle protein
MLRVQPLVLDIIKQLQPALWVLRRKDRSLEDQLRRAIASVALSLAEGFGSRDGNKKLRYQNALGSFDEARMALQVAIAFGYVPALDPALEKQMQDATYMLVSLAKRA